MKLKYLLLILFTFLAVSFVFGAGYSRNTNLNVTNNLIVANQTSLENLTVTGTTTITTLTPASRTFTNVNVTGNITSVERIFFENDLANHQIYDNTTCVVIKAGSTTLQVCE